MRVFRLRSLLIPSACNQYFELGQTYQERSTGKSENSMVPCQRGTTKSFLRSADGAGANLNVGARNWKRIVQFVT
jgi:hypothetical protein